MAPVDPDVSNDNSWPITIFTTRLLLTGGLLAYNVASLRRTSGALPPAHETRQQQLVRRRKVMLFAILAALSALIISYFAIAWRVLEYRTWAEEAGDKKPYSIWRGWYGTPNDPMELQLGRWMQDVNLMTRGTQLQVRSPRGLYWTQMQMLGTLSWSIFVGIEAQRRRFSNVLIFTLVSTAILTGLSVAQNIFFIALSLTPPAAPGSNLASHGSLWTPNSAVYLVPVAAWMVLVHTVPTSPANSQVETFFLNGYFLMPVLMALTAKWAPISWGKTHRDITSAHKSYTNIFHWLSMLSMLLHLTQTVFALVANTPSKKTSTYNYIWTMHSTRERSTFERAESAIGQVLGSIADNPIIAAVGWDVLLSVLSLSAWTFMNALDANDILKCSPPPFSALSVAEEDTKNDTHKHVSFNNDTTTNAVDMDGPPSPAQTKKRGRKPKVAAAEKPVEAPKKGGRKRANSARDDYVPSEAVASEIATTEHSNRGIDNESVELAESSALSWGLFILGGLGTTSAAVLGAEVRRR